MPAFQYWFTGGALAAFVTLLAAIAGLGFGWYRAAVTEMTASTNEAASAAQKDRTAQVKDLLGKAIQDGNKVAGWKGDDLDAWEKSASDWGQYTGSLIDAAYGSGESALFMDNSGYVFYGDGSRKSKIGIWIDGRLRRTTELLRRADQLVVRKDFDPAKFAR